MGNYEILVDIHCHSIASRHAFCTINEIATIAKSKGLKAVAIADHHPSLRHKDGEFEIHAPDFAYFDVFCKRFENIIPEFRIFKAIELNILDYKPWVSPIVPRLKDKFDLKLAGIHTFPHLFEKNDDKEKNTNIILKAIRAEDEPLFNILTHPTMNHVPMNMNTVARACAERGIALEINNSYLSYNKCNPELIFQLVKSVKNNDGRIAVGSDSHAPHEIGMFSQATAILEECKFPPELIINRTVESLENFLSN